MLPPPILIQSGKMTLTRTLSVFSAVGNTDIPPQICSTVYRSYMTSNQNTSESDVITIMTIMTIILGYYYYYKKQK